MKIGIIDVDGHNFPNLPLMKISAWHKSQGDSVEWYRPTISGHLDKVYMSKVFSFTPDYPYFVDTDEVEKGGTGYCIRVENGIEIFDKSKDKQLPDEIEHIYPDYSLYGIEDTAYGFLTRGCPRGCGFCHVGVKEGLKSYKVADISEFWSGQKNIVLLDPNFLACKDWRELYMQLKETNARIEFNQGMDIRLMTPEKAAALSQLKLNKLHFAWDRAEDDLREPFKMFVENYKKRPRDVMVYVLCNFDTNLEQDLFRINELRKLGLSPYVMIYNKESLPKGDIKLKLQRYVNNKFIFWSCESFDEYLKGK